MIKSGKLVFLITFFAWILQSLIFFHEKADELFAILFALVIGGVTVFLLGKNVADEDADFQVNVFLWAFSLRLWMGMILYGWGLSELFGDEDSSGYLMGWQFAENWYRNGFDGFVSDLSAIFFERQNIGQGMIWGIPTFIVGGPSRMIVSVINSFAGALLVIVIFRIARRVFDSHTGRIAAIVVAFWSSHILLSAGTSKEMLVIFFEWMLLYLIIRNPAGLNAKDGLAAIPALLAVFVMRFYSVYILAAATIFRFLVARRQNLFRNAVFGSLLVASLMIFLSAGGAITRDFDRLDRLNTRVDSWRENVVLNTGSGVAVYSEYESTSVALPVATLYFFLAPFPWEMFSGSARNAFGAIENIFIIAILIIGFPALKIFFKDKFVELAPIFVFCALYSGLHIWGLSNVGLAWRHKQTVMPLFAMLVAVGISQRTVGWQMLKGRFAKENRDLNIIRASR